MFRFSIAFVFPSRVSLTCSLPGWPRCAGGAKAQDKRQNAPGEFDFYVLSLSWSPSFCEEAARARRGGARRCSAAGGPISFVVHGLWPQYENGFPELLPAAGAAARPQHRVLDARSDAGAAG